MIVHTQQTEGGRGSDAHRLHPQVKQLTRAELIALLAAQGTMAVGDDDDEAERVPRPCTKIAQGWPKLLDLAQHFD